MSASKFPLLAGRTVQIPTGSKAEMHVGRGRPGFDVTRGVVFNDDGYGKRVVPSFAKEGNPRSPTVFLNLDSSAWQEGWLPIKKRPPSLPAQTGW